MEPDRSTIAGTELAAICGGRYRGRHHMVSFRGACIDSRSVTPGCLFACLLGSQVDGHDYAAAAVGSGASVVLASRPIEVPVGVVECSDVPAALGRLAAWYRDQHPKCTWIGVTGSNGKTTVKECLRAACASSGAVVHATRGNLNNQLGVPLTVLATPAEARWAIVEMGASAPGEIDALAGIVRPDYGVITGIGPAHLEGFGDLLGVARGKSELLRHCQRAAWVSLCGLERACGDDDGQPAAIAAEIRRSAADLTLTMLSTDDSADRIAATEPPALCDGSAIVPLAMSGLHNAWNALLAVEVVAGCGIDRPAAVAAVAAIRSTAGRLRRLRLGEHQCLDDSYNANPASVAAGLSVLAQQPGARLAILGAMGELGDESDELHRQVGAEVARLGLPLLVVGPAAAAIAEGYRQAGGRDCAVVADVAAACDHIATRLAVGPTALLIKASRSAALDRLVAALCAAHGEAV